MLRWSDPDHSNTDHGLAIDDVSVTAIPPTNLVVSKTADTNDGICDADCSLREAITAANSNADTNNITFNIPGSGPDVLLITIGQLQLAQSVNITGPTAKSTTIDGNDTNRVFLFSNGTSTISNLTVAHARATGQPGAGAFVNGAATGTLLNMTFRDNTVTGNNGAGAAVNLGGTLKVVNSTFSNNTAVSGGALYINGATSNLNLLNVTVTNNTGGAGGGLDTGGNPTSIRNSIIANNSTGNINGAFTDLLNNITSGDPLVGPLQDNGGPTFTRDPQPGSPAIDGGNNCATNNSCSPANGFSLTTDQRGKNRNVDGDVNGSQIVDIGACEYQSPEMDVKGNNVSIADGDATPDAADHTDFGSTSISGGTVSRTFTISNGGVENLNLTGVPDKVVVGGANAADFTVTVQPTSPLAFLATTTFTVVFDPSATGPRTATLSIDNNDPNENPYNFAIQGTGAAPDAVFNADGNLAAGTYNNITVNSPAVATVTGDVVVNGCVNVNGGGTLNMGESVFTGPGCFTVNALGRLLIGTNGGIWTVAATGNVQVTGTRTFSSGADYVYNGSANQQVGDGLPSTVANLTIANTGTPGTVTGNSGQIVTGLLEVADGVYVSASDYVNVDIMAAGTLSLANNITVSGNWSNAGTFIPNGFGVTFDGGTGQTIAGTTSFFNLTKSTVAAQTLNFTAGSNTTVTNSLTLNGAAGQLLSLRSTTPGTQWNLVAPSTQSVNFVDAQDSNASGGQLVTATNSVNSGNNVHWFFGCPASLVVTNTGDGTDFDAGDGVCETGSGNGICTLRAAIQEANALTSCAGALAINFNITGGGVQTIAPASALPDSTRAVLIDGYTQPGSSVNTLVAGDNAVIQIELNGTSAGASVDGLRIVGSNSTVRGLAVNRFSRNGIVLVGATGFGDSITVSGNFIGTNAAGTVDLGNLGDGISGENGFGSGSDNNFIGGTTPASRNIISGNSGGGVTFNFCGGNTVQGNLVGLAADGVTALANDGAGIIFGSFTSADLIGGDDAADGTTDGVVNARNYISGNGGAGILLGAAATIQGNYIGTDVTGTVARPNALGIDTNIANSAIIGGTTAGAGNLISGNTGDGISVSNSGSLIIKGNRIGTKADGTTALGNGLSGISFNSGSSAAQVGGIAAGEANIIAFNAGDGVQLNSGTGNLIRANSIHDNGTTANHLGIDLGVDGVTPNDGGDGDTGANDLQNFPLVTGADPTTQMISGTLNSTASTSGYTVDFYKNATCDASGNGEGRTYIGSTTVNTDGAGNGAFAFTAPLATFIAGDVITATVTSPANNTSEFSACFTAPAACVAPAIVYVDDNWVGVTPGTDPDAGGPATNFGCDSFATIQGGINGVQTGGQVIVAAGTYVENPSVTRAMSIKGAQFGVDARNRVASESIVRTNGNQLAVFAVTGTANVTIDGFTIDGDDPGLAGPALLFSGDDTNVQYGVRPTGSGGNLNVSNNIIKKVFIGLRGDVASQGNVVNQNSFDSIGNFDFGYAVSIRNNFYADVTNNKMTRSWTGIHINNHSGGGGPASFNITGNEIHSYAGGILYWLQFNGATGATINNNQMTAEATAVANNFGVLVVSIQNAVNPTFTNNTVSGHNYGVGLFNVPTTSTITLGATNSISGATLAGVFLTDNLNFNPVGTTNFLAGGPGAASTVNVTGMSITGTAGSGLKVEGGTNAQSIVATSATITGFATGVTLQSANAGMTAHFNRIIATTTAIANPNNVTANLENNWWGCNAGPGNAGCGTVTGTGADFDPWIVLLGSATPSSIAPGGTSTVDADMTHNSAGAVPAGTLPNIPDAFSATHGTMNPTNDTMVAGADSSLFTSTDSSSAVATITVDNQNTNVNITVVVPSFTINDVTQSEGNGGPGTTAYLFTVTKSSAGAASVDYNTVDGTATSPSDFTAIPATTLNFLSTDTTKQFTVFVNGDTTFEGNEAFTAHLSNAVGATISDADGTGTITNDDTCTPPAVVYVDASWVGTPIGSDPDAGGPATSFGCDSFATIQGGVTGVASGGTVNVAAGTYTENVTIAQPLTLTGAGAATTTLIPAISAPNTCGGASLCPGGSNLILVQASNVTISGLTLDGDNPGLTSVENFGGANIDARNGIITNHPMGTFNNLEVHHTTIKNIYLRGIYASSGGTFNFHDDTVQNVQASVSSIGMFNFLGAGAFTNNTVSACNDGIASNHSRGTTYTGNTVTTSASGIHSDNAGDSGGTFDTISGNTVTNSQTFGYGIWVFVPYKTVHVNNNTVTNTDVGYALFGDSGMTTATRPAGDIQTPGRKVAPKSANVTEPGSSVQSRVDKSRQSPNGFVSAFAASFTGNTADGQNKANSTGVYFSTNQLGFGSGDPKVEFKSNTVINNVDGFYLEADTGFTLETAASFNRIVGNTNSQVTQSSGAGLTGTVIGSMENNWWGCNAGPNNAGCGTVVGAGVDFNPWLVLTTSASPNPIGPGGTSTVTADLKHNSAAAVPSLTDFVPQVGVAFTATQGTIAPPSDTITSGQATALFTSTSTSSGTGCSAVDNSGAICTNIIVVLPSFSIDDLIQNEGNGGPGTTSYTFTITKTGSTAFNSSVDYNTVNGTATAPSDFAAILTMNQLFLPADTTKQVTVLVNGDTTVEPDEAFTVHLSNAVDATISDADGTGTITNDDSCPPFATVYVDDDWVGTTPGTDPDNIGPATNFGCDSFATIQGGVNAVTSGGTVIVRAGTYPEAVLINKPLTLNGAQVGQNANTRFTAFTGGPANPKADPLVESIITAAATAPASGANDTLHVMASNVTIDGFVVDGNNAALNQAGATVIGGINTDSRRAIQTEDAAGNPFAASNTTVRYNVIQNFAQRGVELINGTASNTAPATTGNLITQNRIRNFGLDGIVLAFNASADITFNTVDTNDYPTEAGIWVQDFLNTGTPYPINISNNNVTVGQDNFGGIWTNLAYLPTLNINSNTVNARAGVTSGSDFTYGIYVTSVRPGSNVSLNGNIVGASGGTFDRGIALWNLGTGQTTTVTGGTVGQAAKGVSLHDNDPNFGLAGSNSAVNLSGVSIDGTTTGIFVDATGSTGDTVAMEISGNTSIINTTTAISVVGANASANIHNNSSSIHDNSVGIDVTGGSATVISNNLYANATGVQLGAGSSVTAHFNRIISTTTAIANPANATANLENNWWGCNAGPGNAGCGAVTGTGADFDSWIVLLGSASPNSIPTLTSSTVTADMTHNSAGAVPVGTLPDIPVSYSATNGTMNPSNDTIVAGTDSSTFTSTNSSNAVATITVDGQAVNVPITITGPACVAPATVYVDDDWAAVTPGTDPDGLGPAMNFGCDSFATIQDGINGVASGGTVKVYAGTYTQANSINLNKSLTLQGPNFAISPNGGVRVAEALITGAPSTVLRISSPGSPVIIEGFKFDSAGVVDAYDPALNITIRKNIYSNGISGGAFYFLNAPTQLTLDDNHLTNAVLADNDTVFVAGNWNGATGTVATITNNVIENTPTDNASGLNLSNVSGTISGNQFTKLRYYGILLANNSSNITISDNVFDGIVNPDQVNVPTWGAGIRFFTPAYTGPVNIKSNTFKNSYVGVGVRASGGNLTGMDIHVNFNRFVGNTFGIRHDGTGPLEAQNNWWGCNAGPGSAGCDSVSEAGPGNTDFDPWIVLGVSAVPNMIGSGGTSMVTADMTKNSDGATPAGGTVPPMPVAWSATNGTMSPPSGTVTAGQAMSTFTSTNSLSGMACAMVDSQQSCTPIAVSGVSFAIDDVAHDEGDAGTTSYVFTVTKSGSTALTSSVNFTTQDGSATLADSDYVMNSGTLTFGPTDTTMQITVLVNGDTTFEPNEAFNVHLSDEVNATISDADGAGTITNDDLPTISGRLTYQDDPTGARNVTMTLTGNNAFVTRTTLTDNNGDYAFTNVPTGNDYVVTPSRLAEVHDDSITAFDASLAAQFAVNLISLTTNKQTAGDSSNNGAVTAFDASQIARYQLTIPTPGSIAGAWKFSPASLSFNNLSANQTDQNGVAILVGDVSGNWTPNRPIKLNRSAPEATITVALPIKQDAPGGPSIIPITVSQTNVPPGVFAYDFDMFFDPAVLQLQGPAFDTAGTLSSGWAVNASTSTDVNGKVHLVLNAFGTTAMTGQGTLINLKFNVVGSSGSTTPLTWAAFNFNEGDPADSDINGIFTAGSPTAAAVKVSGQILTAAGQPVAGATVTVLGGAKVMRAITDSNGYYKVEGLEAGGFYTVTPARANFVFAPASRSFSLVADQTDAVFTGTQVAPEDGNPLENAEFFVRQQYLDFLGREPEQSGLDYWSGQLRACNSNRECINQRRMEVSAAFFIAQEFQDSGLYLYNLYEGGLGRRPAYAEYSVDRRQVVGGPHLEADKAAFAASFVERAEFQQLYPLTMSGEVYVDALLRQAEESSGLDLSGERASLLALYNSGANPTGSRSAVLREVVEGARFKQTQYNAAFVLMEYLGYLGRNPDREGYEFWLNVLNSGQRNNYGGMVCSFITSAEYQRRFSSVMTRSNGDCATVAQAVGRKQKAAKTRTARG
jgi:CSLREA domain-containing protein